MKVPKVLDGYVTGGEEDRMSCLTPLAVSWSLGLILKTIGGRWKSVTEVGPAALV